MSVLLYMHITISQILNKFLIFLSSTTIANNGTLLKVFGTTLEKKSLDIIPHINNHLRVTNTKVTGSDYKIGNCLNFAA